MLGIFKKWFGSAPKADLGALIAGGATILDVRTPAEYAGGHIKGSINIPLQSLKPQMAKIKKDRPVITVCASGMRSASARSMLLAGGFTEVHNGGSWMNLKKFES
jgi:phage shock protein E